MQENKKKQIQQYCIDNNINLINMRNIKKSNKTRITLTCLCKNCQSRYDVMWSTLERQKYKGLCRSCAHRESTTFKALALDEIIQRFENEGYKVITPRNKIKRRGKKSLYFTQVEIMNKYGDIYTCNCNNFCMNLNYYRELSNCDKKNEILKNESRLEYKVRKFLDEINVPYKQVFRFMDCRGEKYPLPFDFCLYYKSDNKLLIEVDGAQHFRKNNIFGINHFKATQKNDRRKNYYCDKNNIPLLRIKYNEIDCKSEIYKEKILQFIKDNQ